MDTLQTLLLVLQVIIAIVLIVFILMQHGKGADAGAAFGSGASSTVFGARGSGGFLVKATTVLAFIFLCNSLFLGYLTSHNKPAQQSLMDSVPTVQEQPKQNKTPDKKADASTSTKSAPVQPDSSNDMPADQDKPVSDVPEIPAQ